MKKVEELMIAISSLILVLFLSSDAVAQPTTREDLFNYLAQSGPTKGNGKAPIMLIEFSDFRCSFCRKFWKETLPSLEKKYIETGKVKFLYRHFAVLGKPSELAAQAAECAGEQRKFWEYHDKLFVSAGSPLAFADRKLKGYAEELGLKSQPFNLCLDSGKHLKKVQGETAIASLLGARGTPVFFLNGRMLVGAQPFEVFQSLIEEDLKKVSSSGKVKR
jgi:protein-disulfide isomerase